MWFHYLTCGLLALATGLATGSLVAHWMLVELRRDRDAWRGAAEGWESAAHRWEAVARSRGPR